MNDGNAMKDGSGGQGPGRTTLPSPLLVDAHVHFHPGFNRSDFLNSAAGNFQRAAAELALGPAWLGCLLFTESRGDHYFEDLRRNRVLDGGRWAIDATEESCSLIAKDDGEPRLLLVAGRQVVSAEDIEVLALGTDRQFEDGAEFSSTLRSVLESDAVAALPWGFGKWWFRRGRLVREVIERAGAKRIFLGDNGGRLALLPRPPMFDVAARRGFLILPGSDPLPLPSQIAKVGGYGFVLPGPLDASRPAESLKRILTDLAAQPRIFGRLETPAAFCRNQVMMQLRKRARMGRP